MAPHNPAMAELIPLFEASRDRALEDAATKAKAPLPRASLHEQPPNYGRKEAQRPGCGSRGLPEGGSARKETSPLSRARSVT